MQNQATDTRQDHNNPDNNQTILRLIDGAVAATRGAAHACGNPAARRHFEYALALITEAWIAEDGQQARTAPKVIEDVTKGCALLDLVFANTGGKESH